MTSGLLAWLIFIAIVGQVAAFVLLGRYRRRVQQREPGRAASAGDVPGPGPTGQEAVRAWEGLREFVVERRVVEDGLGSVCSFYLTPTDGKPLPGFRPGQYLTFSLPVIDQASGQPKTLVRCYSLSDRPRPDYYRVTIKRVAPPPDKPGVPPGLSSSYFHEQVREGSRLLVKVPAGHFYLDEASSLPVVLVGGGIGITPMLSMLESLLELPGAREVWLYYGVRNGREHVMKEHLEALAAAHANFHLHVCYSRPDVDDVEGVDYRHHGHVDLALLRATLRLARYQFYVCGPRPMMESLVPALRDWGVSEEDIRYESFGPASLNRHEVPETILLNTAKPAAVTFSKSGRVLNWDNAADSLLAFAEANGIAVESGCRAGSCGSCQTRLEAGTVQYKQQADADVMPGHCLLCIGVPDGDLTLAL